MTATARATGTVAVDSWEVTARATGRVSVVGDNVVARARGHVEVVEATFRARARGLVAVHGAPTHARASSTLAVHRFTGTGVVRSRRRSPHPFLVGAGPLVARVVPPDEEEEPPPPPTAATSVLGHEFWTEPLPADAPLAATSASFVARVAYQATQGKTSDPVRMGYNPPGNTYTNGSNTPPPFGSSYALPIYRMPPGAPRVPVYTLRQKAGLQDVLDDGVPLPDPQLLPGGTIPPSGTDGSVVIIDTDTGELWELWQVRTRAQAIARGFDVPDGYEWVISQGGKMDDRSTHPGIWSAPPSWGVAASGTAKVGGMLTAEDFYGTRIGHPLGLSLPISGGDHTVPEPHRILPATRYDWRANIPGGAAQQPLAEHLRVCEGTRFRLPATFDIEAYVAGLPIVTAGRFGTDPTTLRKILTAVRDHGMIVADSADVVAFSAEHPKTFGTPYNPYTLEQAPVWGNFGQQIPWAQLVQVAVPTVDISVSGAG